MDRNYCIYITWYHKIPSKYIILNKKIYILKIYYYILILLEKRGWAWPLSEEHQRVQHSPCSWNTGVSAYFSCKNAISDPLVLLLSLLDGLTATAVLQRYPDLTGRDMTKNSEARQKLDERVKRSSTQTWLSSLSMLASSRFRMNFFWKSMLRSSLMCSENLCSGLKHGETERLSQTMRYDHCHRIRANPPSSYMRVLLVLLMMTALPVWSTLWSMPK